LLVAGLWAALMAALPACVGVPTNPTPLEPAALNPPVGARCRVAMVSPIMGPAGKPVDSERWIEGTVAEVTPDSIVLVNGVQKVRRENPAANSSNPLSQMASTKDLGWEDVPFEKTRFPKKSITSVQVVTPPAGGKTAAAPTGTTTSSACANGTCGHRH